MNQVYEAIEDHVMSVDCCIMEEEGYVMSEGLQEQLNEITETLMEEFEDRLTELFNEVEWEKKA